jgi:hypothetical protein
MGNIKPEVCGKTIAYGRQRWRVDANNNWQVLMFGSHGPNDPPVGLSWKWVWISADRVPEEVKRLA